MTRRENRSMRLSAPNELPSDHAPVSEENLRLATEVSLAGVYIRQGGRFRYVNPALSRITAYTREELCARFSLHDLVVEEDRPQLQEKIPPREDGDRSHLDCQVRIARRDERQAWLRILEVETKFEDQPATLGTVLDITEFRQVEEQLWLRNRALDASTEGICIAGPIKEDNLVLFANREFERVTGYELEEILGRNLRFLQGPDTDQAQVGRLREAIQSEQTYYGDILNYRKDGTPYWCRISITPITNPAGGATHFVAVKRDITQEKHMSLALEESEGRHRALTTSTCDAIVSIDIRGNIVDWNPAAERIFGHSRTEIIGQPLSLLVPPPYLQLHLAGLERLRAGYAPRILGQRIEIDALRKDGTLCPVELTLSQWAVSSDRFFSAIIHDITARKQTEAGLRTSQRHLKQTQTILTQTGKMALIGQLASGIAHQVNNPMAVISSSAEILSHLIHEGAESGQPDHDRILRHLDKITQHVFRAKSIIESLLSFARRPTLNEWLPVDPGQLLKSALELIPKTRRGNVQIVFEIEEGPPGALEIRTIPTRLEQILINLTINALDACRPDGRVTLSARGEPAAVVLGIADQGEGLTKKELSRLFEPFYTTKLSEKGTGLGLFLCHQWVESLGGTIAIESRLGEGTCAWVRIPRVPPAGSEETEA